MHILHFYFVQQNYLKKYERHELDFGIKLKLKLLLTIIPKKLILPKISLNSIFAKVHHICIPKHVTLHISGLVTFENCMV